MHKYLLDITTLSLIPPSVSKTEPPMTLEVCSVDDVPHWALSGYVQ